MDNENLNVWYDKQLVGKLWQDAVGRIGFHYEDSWVHNGFPISQQFPLIIKEYLPESNKAHRFFVT